MRIRSPSRAPPVFLFEGSTETTAKRFSGKSNKNRRTNSSTIELFPAPPVPVIPKIGVAIPPAFSETSFSDAACSSPQFSAALIQRAIVAVEAVPSDAASDGKASPTKKSDCSIKSLIMPCNPIFLPSSGWYNRVIPYACNSSISSGNMVPPPPPNILICPAPFSWSRSYMYLKYSMCPPW